MNFLLQLYVANFKQVFALKVDVDDFSATHVRIYPFSSTTINLQLELLAKQPNGNNCIIIKQKHIQGRKL